MRARIRDGAGRFLSPIVCEAVHEASHVITALSLNIRVHYVTLVDELEDGGGGTCSTTNIDAGGAGAMTAATGGAAAC